MAINDIVQTIAEARVDARSLSDFVFKPAGFKVARRLAPPVDTLQFYINRFNSLNGDFSSSVSVALSSLNNSVAEANGKVAYIETTVQDAINNTAVEGGVLADTFVTMTANGVGTVARNLRDVKSDLRNVKDFGAKGDGVTDDSDAFQKYVDWSIANGSNYIFVPFGNSEKYRLTRTINIPASGFMIDGNSRARYSPHVMGGYIFADANVLDLFNYGVGQSFPTNQFRVNGVALLSTTGYTQNAFKIDANNNGPHRGMVFSDTCAKGFVDVIQLSTTNPTYLSAANVVIESGCVFSGNTNLVNAVTRLFGLCVQGVQAEQGARFKGFIDGGVSFRDCMLEGQADVIDISANTPQIVLENNYMEKSMGRFFVRARGTNSNALFEERSNFISDVRSTDCYLMEGVIRVKQDFEYQNRNDRFSLYTFNDLTLGFGSKIKGSVYVATDASKMESGFTGYCEPESLRQSRATAVKNKSLGTDVLKTPFGQTATGLTVTGTSGYLTLNKSWDVGYVVTITALVRANAAARLSLDLYNQEFSPMRGMGGITVPLNKVGDWQIMCISRPVTVAGTAMKLRFTMPEGTLDIAAIGIDVTKAADFKSFNNVSRAEVQLFNPLIADGTINSYTRETSVTIPELAANEKFTFDGYITGAEVGDVVAVSPNIDTLDVTWSARVFEDNQVRVTLWNRGAESVTLGYSKWKFKLFKE